MSDWERTNDFTQRVAGGMTAFDALLSWRDSEALCLVQKGEALVFCHQDDVQEVEADLNRDSRIIIESRRIYVQPSRLQELDSWCTEPPRSAVQKGHIAFNERVDFDDGRIMLVQVIQKGDPQNESSHIVLTLYSSDWDQIASSSGPGKLSGRLEMGYGSSLYRVIIKPDHRKDPLMSAVETLEWYQEQVQALVRMQGEAVLAVLSSLTTDGGQRAEATIRKLKQGIAK